MGLIFGNRLKELREESGLSMKQLAGALDVSDAAICKWENGLAEPKAGYIIKIAEHFGCSADYLLGLDCDLSSENKAYVDRFVRTFSEGETELLEAYLKLPKELKELLIKTAKSWV